MGSLRRGRERGTRELGGGIEEADPHHAFSLPSGPAFGEQQGHLQAHLAQVDELASKVPLDVLLSVTIALLVVPDVFRVMQL